MKLQELIDNLDKINAVDFQELNGFVGFKLGRKNSHTYYWFTVSLSTTECWFDHSYSCNTGKVTKSLRANYNILKKLGYFN